VTSTPTASSSATSTAPKTIDTPPAVETPSIALASDGFPTGRTTPEGVACDFARTFINVDADALLALVVPPLGNGESATEYQAFLDDISAQTREQQARNPADRNAPKRITECYAARPLSRSGPASVAYAVFDYYDLLFVDVVIEECSGNLFTCRTLALMNKDGVWSVLPAPEYYPMLAMGLNEEPDSVIRFDAPDAASLRKPQEPAAP